MEYIRRLGDRNYTFYTIDDMETAIELYKIYPLQDVFENHMELFGIEFYYEINDFYISS